MNNSIQWLESVCSTEQARASKLGHPWTIHHDGEPWTVASDGFVLAMTRGDFGYPPADEHTPNFGHVFVPKTVRAHCLPLAPLRELATPWVAVPLADCDACENSGQVECKACDGDGFEACECSCGHEHEAECAPCDGKGFVGCTSCLRGLAEQEETRPVPEQEETRPVRIGDGYFDLRKFVPLLPHIDGEVAEFRQQAPDRAGAITVGPWEVLVMPLRYEESKCKNAPRVEFAAFAAVAVEETPNS